MEIVERASKPPAEEAPDRQQSSRESAQTSATTMTMTTTTFANDNDSTKMSENQREAHTAIATCIPYIPNHRTIEETEESHPFETTCATTITTCSEAGGSETAASRLRLRCIQFA